MLSNAEGADGQHSPRSNRQAVSECPKDVFALVIAIVPLMLMWLPTWDGMYRLPPETDKGSRSIRSQPVSAIGSASVAEEAPGRER